MGTLLFIELGWRCEMRINENTQGILISKLIQILHSKILCTSHHVGETNEIHQHIRNIGCVFVCLLCCLQRDAGVEMKRERYQRFNCYFKGVKFQ